MKLSELITTDLVEVPLRAADKWEALAAIARIPVRGGRYPETMVPIVEQALEPSAVVFPNLAHLVRSINLEFFITVSRLFGALVAGKKDV